MLSRFITLPPTNVPHATKEFLGFSKSKVGCHTASPYRFPNEFRKCVTLAAVVTFFPTNQPPQVTKEFLEFSKSKGNDLMTPAPWYNFPGLKPGDKWCLCALRWKEAFDAGVAPPVSCGCSGQGWL